MEVRRVSTTPGMEAVGRRRKPKPGSGSFAIRYNGTVTRYTQRQRAKTNVIVAKKAVAHKLARACFQVLRGQVALDVNKAFGYSK